MSQSNRFGASMCEGLKQRRLGVSRERRGTECGEGGGKGLTIASLRHLP